jgi:hypothetical protein
VKIVAKAGINKTKLTAYVTLSNVFAKCLEIHTSDDDTTVDQAEKAFEKQNRLLKHKRNQQKWITEISSNPLLMNTYSSNLRGDISQNWIRHPVVKPQQELDKKFSYI